MSQTLGIFLSYATEDRDIVKQFVKTLNLTLSNADSVVRIFSDYKSIKLGSDISTSIQDALYNSQYMIVFYTGVLKKSHSWTGQELGFYQSFMYRKSTGDIPRSVVSVYLGKPPEPLQDQLGLPLHIERKELSLSRAKFAERLKQKLPELKDSPLAVFLQKIAREANKYLPPVDDDSEKQRKREADLALKMDEIAGVIVPDLWLGLYECMGARVVKPTIEQKLIEFEIDGSSMVSRVEGIPDEANLIEREGALKIFGIANDSYTYTWGRFIDELGSTYSDKMPMIRRAIEAVFDSALSSAIPVDNDRLIVSPVDKRVYRIIVTRHFNFYNGSKVLHMYFIEKWRPSGYGDEDTSLLLAILNVAASYRFIFIEKNSVLSLPALQLLSDDASLVDAIHRLMQELILIEDESSQLELTDIKAMRVLFGDDLNVDEIKAMQLEWTDRRRSLKDSADKMLSTSTSDPTFEHIKNEWFAVLAEFTKSAEGINSVWGKRALAQLVEFF